jgi:hypothetical protein
MENKITLSIKVNNPKGNYAFRVLTNEKVVFYTSTRIGGVKTEKGNFVIELDEKFAGKEYELKEIESRKIVKTGKIKIEESK